MSVLRALVKKLGPGWLVKDQLPDGTETDSRVLWAISLVLDALLARTQSGILARHPGPFGASSPDTLGAPDDALPYLGRDRLLVRGPDEAPEVYAARLARSLDDHRTRGNPFALLEQLRAYMAPHAVRVRTYSNRGDCYTIDRDGTRSVERATAWDWDGNSAHWSRFWVVIYPTTGSPREPFDVLPDWDDPALWGGEWDGTSNTTWGSTATPEQVQAIRRIVQTWKPDGTRCVSIVIAFDDASLAPGGADLPDGLWGRSAKVVGGVYVPARLSTARYWEGTSGGTT